MKHFYIALVTALAALSCGHAIAAQAAHFVDENKVPLPQYEWIYEKMLRYYPTSMPDQVTILFTDNDSSQFNVYSNSILLSRRYFQNHASQVIAHETSHLALYRMTNGASLLNGDKGPFRFFDEGYANIIEARIVDQEDDYKKAEALPTAAVQHQRKNVSFAKVQDWIHYFGDSSGLNFFAYPVGSSFDFFILDTFGQTGLDAFFTDIGATKDLNRTFQKVFGRTQEEIESAWLSYLAAVDLLGAQPEIVSLSPENGAVDVDPGIRELTVRFNVPMSPGWRIITDHDEIDYKQAGWQDVSRTTLIITVKGTLQRNHTYTIHLGKDRRRFTSRTGLEMPPVVWTFRTR